MIDAAVRGELSRTQGLRLCRDNPEVITLALLAAAKRIAEQDARITELEGNGRGAHPSPSTPSGMVPIYTKPNTPKRRKKPGAKEGHPGHRRKAPTRIDQHKTHRLKRCPCCGGALQRCARTRTRLIEDIPEEIEPVITEHTIHRPRRRRAWCPFTPSPTRRSDVRNRGPRRGIRGIDAKRPRGSINAKHIA